MNLSSLFGGGGVGSAWQSRFRLITTGSTHPTVVKASEGVLGGIYLNCPSGDGNIACLKIFDKNTTPVPGTDVPVLVFYTTPWGAGSTEEGVIFTPANGIRFYNGISIATVSGVADSSNTAASTGSVVSIVYT
jgi:hypothetical protein